MTEELSMEDLIDETEMEMQEVIEKFETQLASLRTGRATPAILDPVKVEYYGTPTALKQLASVSVVEGQTLVVKPYDASSLKDIEKAIIVSDIGINPANDGKVIRLVVPSMTEDKRKKLASELSQISEKYKTNVRNARRDSNKKVDASQKEKIISEDQAHDYKDSVQELTKTYENKIIELQKKKEDEILNF